MGCDPFSPVSLAQINVVCLPVSRISKKKFLECVNALKASARTTVPNGSLNGATNGASKTQGRILLNISNIYSNDEKAQLYPFDINREPQIVLGIDVDEDTSQVVPQQNKEETFSPTTKLREHAGLYKHVITSAVVQFGKASAGAVDDRVYVESSQNSTSAVEAVSEIVARYQRALPGFMEQLHSNSVALPSLNSSTRRTSISSNISDRRESMSVSENRSREASQQVSGTVCRETITFGILYLQAGQWLHSLRLLSEGTTSARASGDHLWHARGLEALLVCMLLMVWSRIEFKIPQTCFPANERQSQMGYSSFMDAILNANRANSVSLFGSTSTRSADTLTELLPHLLGLIFGLYERAVNSVDSTLPFLFLCEARVRWLNLLVTVRAYGSALTNECVRSIVGNSIEPPTAIDSKTNGPILILQKTSFSQMLGDASLEAQAKLTPESSATLQLALAKTFSLIGIERKQGFHLKQFLQRLTPAIIEARRRGAAELGLHPSATLPQLNDSIDMEATGLNRGIAAMLQFVGNAYGLPTELAKFGESSSTPLQRLRASLEFWRAAHMSGDLFMKLEILGICIEISDALPDPRSSLCFTSYLLQASKRSITVNSRQNGTAPLISPEDLPRILENIQRAIASAENLGVPTCRSHYWDKFLVRNIVLLQDLWSNRLMPHTAQDLSLAAGSEAEIEAKKDPFIFNPFAKPKVTQGPEVVSIGDILYFEVLLQNPLETEIEITDITILTQGSKFKPVHHSIVLGPLCTQLFTLSGIPEECGQLTVVGCNATIHGCFQEDFLILPDDWTPPYMIKQRTSSKLLLDQQSLNMPSPKTLPLKVIEPLPLLSVTSTSLSQPFLMSIDGERSQFCLTLRNDSKIDIDFLTITFDDSVKQHLEEALASKELNPADTYEVQLQVIHEPAARLLNEPQGVKIEAGRSYTFDIEILGKPGLTFVNVLIDYTCLNKPISQITETFYTRQLTHSIATTVNGGVDIPRCMIVPFAGNTNRLTLNEETGTAETHSPLTELPATNVDDEKCILLLDMRNLWPHSLEVTCRATYPLDEGTNAISNTQYNPTSELLQPGQVTRVVLVVPRIFISDAGIAVPNLDTRRQFVVSVSKLSIEAEAAARETFWYREKLLACLNAEWKEEHGSRRGRVDLRKGLRLTARMIEALRIDLVDISFRLKPDYEAHNDTKDDKCVDAVGFSHYALKRNHFAVLKVKVRNRGDTELKLILRLQPSLRNQPHNIALELSKRFVWSGTLQQALHPPLRPGETRDLELGVLVLANGEYEVNGLVEEITRGVPKNGASLKGPGATDERRIWHARHPCQIDVVGV